MLGADDDAWELLEWPHLGQGWRCHLETLLAGEELASQCGQGLYVMHPKRVDNSWNRVSNSAVRLE